MPWVCITSQVINPAITNAIAENANLDFVISKAPAVEIAAVPALAPAATCPEITNGVSATIHAPRGVGARILPMPVGM